MLHHIAAVGGSLAKRYIEDGMEVNDPSGSNPPASNDEAILAGLPLAIYFITALLFIYPAIGVSRHLVNTISLVHDANRPQQHRSITQRTWSSQRWL